ncbi:MAG TPA: cache domain-containing protein, partial [Pyrinomonadaceae bacterium]
MPFKRPKLKYFNTISLTLMLILGPFGLYYLFYFSEQKTYFTNRNFRLLSVLNKQIQAKVDGVAGAYQKAAESATQAYLPTKPGDFQMDGFLRPIVKDGNDIVLDSLLLKSPAEGQKVVTYDIKQESGSQFLVLDYTGSDGTSAVNIRVKGKLEDLLAPFARKLIDKNNFDGVLIAEEDGKVFFEQGASELGVTNLQGLVNEDQQKIDFERLRQNSNVFEAHIAQTNYKVFIQPVRLSYAKTGADAGKSSGWVVCGLVSSGHFLSESAAISYTVLITMTFLAIVVALSAPFLKLLFMKPRERVQVADVYFLAFSALVGTALIATFLVYSLSYWNLERQLDDQLRTLSTQIRSNFENELRDANRQLERLNTSGRVQETIRILSKLDDLNRPGDTLDSNSSISTTDLSGQLNRSLDKLDQIDRNQTTNREHPSDQGWKNNYGCPQGKRCSGQTGILGQLVGYRDHYPYLSSAFWADRDGQQRIKWTTKADLTPFISVNSRPYFRHVADGRPWEFEYSSGDKDGRKLFKYFLEPVYSMTTGGQQVILSAPVPPLENESNGRSWVSAMDIRPLSLMQVVLPSDLGYGYCVIDHDGKVLFHSDPSRNLLENFFAETDNNDYLRSVVLANESKPMTLSYQGLGHRLFVTPLPNTPWSLITFRDKHILRVAALELITYAIFLFVLYALLLLLLFGIYHLWKSLDRPAIAWPYSKRAKNYNFSIIVNLALALAFLVAIFSVRGWAAIAFAVVLPVIGFLFHHWNLKKGPSFGRVGANVSHFIERYTPLDYRSGYIFTMVTLLILVSLLPMLTFFKFAYDREMSLYVKLGQISLARGLHERADRLHSHYQLNGHSSGAIDEQKSQSIEDNR